MTREKIQKINIKFQDLLDKINEIKSDRFSGNLIIRIDNISSWTLSFADGKLAEVSGGIDSENRFQRNLAVACLNLSVDRFVKSNNNEEIFLNSNAIAQQYAIGEILFDIMQFSQHKRDRLSYQFIPSGDRYLFSDNLPLLDIEPILTTAIKAWEEWVSMGLAAYPPSLFPTVQMSAQILRLIDSQNIHNIIPSFDGSRSLRSLAVYQQQHLLDFTKPLLPLLLLGGINLSLPSKSPLDRISNWQNSTFSIFNNSCDRSTTVAPLIACIDDSISIYHSLEKILTDCNYRTLGVQEPVNILPILIKNKPDFIFLDLLMPTINGYEVCKQIRKTPCLKNTPVVILTGKDSSIDRLRAKLVGANEFISKPVRAESVLTMLDKYLNKYSLN